MHRYTIMLLRIKDDTNMYQSQQVLQSFLPTTSELKSKKVKGRKGLVFAVYRCIFIRSSGTGGCVGRRWLVASRSPYGFGRRRDRGQSWGARTCIALSPVLHHHFTNGLPHLGGLQSKNENQVKTTKYDENKKTKLDVSHLSATKGRTKHGHVISTVKGLDG